MLLCIHGPENLGEKAKPSKGKCSGFLVEDERYFTRFTYQADHIPFVMIYGPAETSAETSTGDKNIEMVHGNMLDMDREPTQPQATTNPRIFMLEGLKIHTLYLPTSLQCT